MIPNPHEQLIRRRAIWDSLSPDERWRGIYNENYGSAPWNALPSGDQKEISARWIASIHAYGLDAFLGAWPVRQWLDNIIANVRTVRIDVSILGLR